MNMLLTFRLRGPTGCLVGVNDGIETHVLPFCAQSLKSYPDPADKSGEMVWDDLAEAEENRGVLIEVELEIHHRLEGHYRALRQCPPCRAHAASSRPLVRA